MNRFLKQFGPVILLLGVLAFVIWQTVHSDENFTPEGPEEICADNAYKEYDKADIALEQQIDAALKEDRSITKLEIAQRRLDEEYCSEVATCFADPQSKNPEADFSELFSECIRKTGS